MSILDRHPAPWRYDSPEFAQMSILDANGKPVAAPTTQIKDETNEIDFASPEVELLILAAPELLAKLRRFCDAVDADIDVIHTREVEGALLDARVLIARIEGGNG